MRFVNAADDDGPTAPGHVEYTASAFIDGADRLLGARLGERRFDHDRGLRVTVVDLTDDDVAAITGLATGLGIAAWVRIDRADPGDLADWERLRHDLRRLAQDRGVLTLCPTLTPVYRRPPVTIVLAAYAEDRAAALHTAYGDFVALRVGALPYPPTTTPTPSRSDVPAEPRETVDPTELIVELASPLTIGSGRTTSHAVVLVNRSASPVDVHTNGTLTPRVVDDTGDVVGGFVGPQTLPLVVFTASPGGTVRVPLLVGTASLRPELGYAIPPGPWRLTVPLNLGDGRQLTSPPLPFTVTA